MERNCPYCNGLIKDHFIFCDKCGLKVDEFFKSHPIVTPKGKVSILRPLLEFLGIFACYFYLFPFVAVFGYLIGNGISPKMFPNPELLTDESYMLLNMILQDISNVMVVALLAIIIIKRKQVKEVLGLTRENKKESFLNTLKEGALTFAFMYAVMFVINLISILVFPAIQEDNANQSIINDIILNYPVFGFISVAIIAPVVEELVFRFMLCKPFEKVKKFLGVILSALIFGGIHMVASIQEGTFIDDLPSLIVYVAMGAALSYRYVKTDNLASNVFAHAIYNTMAFIAIIAG